MHQQCAGEAEHADPAFAWPLTKTLTVDDHPFGRCPRRVDGRAVAGSHAGGGRRAGGWVRWRQGHAASVAANTGI